MNYVSLYNRALLKLLTVITYIALPVFVQGADLAGCAETLKKNLCYSEPTEHWLGARDLVAAVKNYQNRKCLPAPEASFQVITDLYESFPVEVQKAFCEIKRVYLVRGNVSYGAIAEYYFEPSSIQVEEKVAYSQVRMRPTGYVLEISEQNRFKGETASAYTSRVFQARFGQDVANKGLAKDLPVSTYVTPFGNHGALATTIIHEIGHMLSRAHRVTTNFWRPKLETPWTKLSWSLEGDSYSIQNIDSGLSERIRTKSLDRSDVPAVIELLKESGMPTLYAATNVEEEFAEQFMLNFYDQFTWKVGSETVLDLQAEMQTNPAFKAKRDLIREMLKSPNPYSLENFGVMEGAL